MEAIASKYLIQLQRRTELMGIRLHLPKELAQILVRRCRDKGGARALRRLVQEEVEGPLAAFLLTCCRKPACINGNLKEEKILFV